MISEKILFPISILNFCRAPNRAHHSTRMKDCLLDNDRFATAGNCLEQLDMRSNWPLARSLAWVYFASNGAAPELLAAAACDSLHRRMTLLETKKNKSGQRTDDRWVHCLAIAIKIKGDVDVKKAARGHLSPRARSRKIALLPQSPQLNAWRRNGHIIMTFLLKTKFEWRREKTATANLAAKKNSAFRECNILESYFFTDVGFLVFDGGLKKALVCDAASSRK